MVHLKRRADGEGVAETIEAKDPTPDDVAVTKEESATVKGVLDELPQDQRKVIELAYFNGFTHSEISEMLDIPLGTIKGRMRLGLEKMRSSLEESGEMASSGS